MNDGNEAEPKLLDKQQLKELSIEMVVIAFLAGAFSTGGKVVATIFVASVLYVALLGLLLIYNAVRRQRWRRRQGVSA